MLASTKKAMAEGYTPIKIQNFSKQNKKEE